MKINEWLASIGIDITLMMAGMFGSLLMISKKSAYNIKAAMIGIVSGTLSANYLTSIFINLFELEGKSQYGIAFLLGYFGLKGVETIINKITKHKDGVD
jgi:hypothetical protein